jgi:pSer/pThr/pTyr-binding forkhead associated (FHA) protein
LSNDASSDSGAGSASGVTIRHWVEYRGHNLELRAGSTVVGRSTACQIMIDDGLVSRRHAELVVNGDRCSVADAGSVNGVFVNGTKLAAPVELRNGDRVTIGKQDLVYRSTRATSVENAQRLSAETLHGTDLATLARTRPNAPRHQDESEATTRGNVLELLGSVAQKVLALGRGEEAERLLGTSLDNLLIEARDGRSVAPEQLALAADYAVRIAGATLKAKWVDYAVELYTRNRRPWPAPVIEQLYDVLRRVPGVSVVSFREYLDVLHELELGPAERFLVQRIEGLEQLLR